MSLPNMHWLLKHSLRRVARHADPDTRFLYLLECRLKAELGHSVWWVPVWKWIMVATTVTTLAGSGTAVYAYTSDDVLPDHPLYVLRTSIERTEESFAEPQAEKKLHVKLKLLKRRLHEIEILSAHHKKIPQETKKTIHTMVDQTFDALEKLPAPEQVGRFESPNSQEVIAKTFDRVIEQLHTFKFAKEEEDSQETPEYWQEQEDKPSLKREGEAPE